MQSPFDLSKLDGLARKLLKRGLAHGDADMLIMKLRATTATV